MALTIELPKAFQVDDYHEIPVVEDLLRTLSGDKNITVDEVKAAPVKGNEDGQVFYWGVIYKGDKPNNDEIIKALEDANCAYREDTP